MLNEATTGAAHSDDTTDVRMSWSAPATLIVTGSVPADETNDELDAAMLDPSQRNA